MCLASGSLRAGFSPMRYTALTFSSSIAGNMAVKASPGSAGRLHPQASSNFCLRDSMATP